VNIEDGRGEGKLADVETQCALIAAMKARVPDLFVNARTDTHWFGIGPVSEAVSRVKAYADAGADGVFVPALTDSEGIEAVVRAVDLPVNVLFSPTGPSVARLAEFGVARISLGSLPYRVALAAAAEAVAAVRDGRPLPLTPPTYAEVTTLLPSS
jgi:2-methylisocitrate lyase-like PEP mutase family enzyme